MAPDSTEIRTNEELPVPTTDSDTRALPPEFLASIRGNEHRLDLDVLTLAFQFSAARHEGQKRSSGEDYITHCIAVASILAEIHPDTVSIAASFLHDVVEDSGSTVEEIRQEFGDEIATIVDALTKISRVEIRSLAERQVESYRKLLLSMARDARVIIVKLADRLHNMRTLEHLDRDRQRRIALETKEIYAPLAHRLGMARVRWELEDLAFKFLEPEEYRAVADTIAEKRSEREDLIERMVGPLHEELMDAGLAARVEGRAKHLWSIHRKMQLRQKPYEEIYDVLAVRVVLPSIRDCYHALGVIHNKWTPLTERFHDYIATPKSNLYQSLHTTIFGPGGRLYEIQLRTEEMHRTAELGIAAHWRYKEGTAGDEVDETLTWFRQVLEWQQETREPDEFLEFLKIDLFQDEIFVFTPNGDLKHLPKGSTPIDFAYSIHTDVGSHCAGARVDGRLVSLKHSLESGSTVEVVTSEAARPSRDWLGLVATSRARSKIRHYLREQADGESIILGRRIIDKELKKLGRSASDVSLDDVAQRFGLDGTQDLAAAVGRINEARAYYQIAGGQYWPQIAADGSFTRTEVAENGPLGGLVGAGGGSL